jgi:hypothetical protein
VVCDVLKDTLDVWSEALNAGYLRMPTDVGSSRSVTFKFIRYCVWSKVKGWLEKILSAGGKEVLIKSVNRAILVYSMARFRLPHGLCEHINSLSRQFWWESKESKRKPCWVSSDVMTLPKHLGGMGFTDLELFNLCLLPDNLGV